MNIRFATAACTIAACLVTTAATARPLTIEDLDRVERVGDAQISPDGQQVLYTVTTTDVAADTRRTAVWRVGWDGKAPVRLTAESESAQAPRWSPDGRWISFIKSSEGAGQVWLLDSSGSGQARVATDVAGGVSDYVWSPDGKRLAIVYRQETPLRKGGDGKDIPEPWVIDRVRFKEDAGDGYLHNRIKPERIYLYDLQAKTFEPLTAGGEFEEDSPVWSPSGDRIAFVSNRGADWQYSDYGDIYVAPAQPGSTPQRLTDFPGADGSPAWSPDGREIAYLQGSEPQYWMYNQTGLAVVPAAGGTPRLLATELDRDIGSPSFTADGRSIRFMVTDNRLRYPAEVPAADGKVKRLLEGNYRVGSASAAKGGRTVVVATSDRRPDEVYALEQGRLRPLTRHNDAWLSEVELVEAEDVDFVAADGERIYGLLTRPVGYRKGQRYPLVLWLHGGPYGQDSHGFHQVRQIFAANGYAVLHVNFRGSSGRGKAVGRGIFRDWGNRDVSDSLAGVDHAVALGVADPDRLLVGGWSYGGFMTDFLIVSDTRFKAAISGAGSPTKTSLYGTDLYAHGNELEWGTPWDDTDTWMRVSRPLYQAGRVRTPTLFIHGVKDYNVPVSGSEQMYRALKTLRVPTQLVIYPGEHHGIGRPSFVRDLSRRYLEWYARYLSPEAAR